MTALLAMMDKYAESTCTTARIRDQEGLEAERGRAVARTLNKNLSTFQPIKLCCESVGNYLFFPLSEQQQIFKIN